MDALSGGHFHSVPEVVCVSVLKMECVQQPFLIKAGLCARSNLGL